MKPAVFYEYSTEVFASNFGSKKRKRSNLDKLLTRKAEDGWRLDAVLTDQNLEGESDGHILIFSRPLP